MEAFGAFVALLLGVTVVGCGGLTAFLLRRRLAGALRSFRALPAPPRIDEVADVAVRIVHRGARTELMARALVPGGPAVAERTAAQLADDEPLPQHVRAHLRDDLPSARVRSDGTTIVLTSSALAGRDLDAAVVVVAELARRGMDAVHALRALPGAVYDPPRGPWDARTPPRVRLPDHDVTFELTAHPAPPHGGRTVAWTEIGPSPPAPLAPPVVLDGARPVYAFDTVETDGAKLLAAAAALRTIARATRAERYG